MKENIQTGWRLNEFEWLPKKKKKKKYSKVKSKMKKNNEKIPLENLYEAVE